MTQNAYFSLLTDTKKLLSVEFCETTAGLCDGTNRANDSHLKLSNFLCNWNECILKYIRKLSEFVSKHNFCSPFLPVSHATHTLKTVTYFFPFFLR